MADEHMEGATTMDTMNEREVKADWLVQVFLSEVGTQCRFALMARADIETVFQRMHGPHSGEPEPPVDPLRIFYSVQAFLSACANAAKLLWPRTTTYNDEPEEQVRERVERGKRLRKMLGISNKGAALAILKDKRLRNYFEHFDERLDEWASTSTHHNLITRCSGTPGSIMIPGMGPSDTMGYLDLSTGEVTFQDLVVSLPQMYTAINELHARVQVAIQKMRSAPRHAESANASTGADVVKPVLASND